MSIFWNPLAIIFENLKKGCELEKGYTKNQKPEFVKYYQYKQKAHDYLSDLCQTIFPINDPKDNFWQESASGVVKGILLAILYNMQEKNKFELDKFNLAEVVPIINDQEELINYLKHIYNMYFPISFIEIRSMKIVCLPFFINLLVFLYISTLLIINDKKIHFLKIKNKRVYQ